MESLSNKDGNGYENLNQLSSSRAASNFIALIPPRSIRQMLAIFFWSCMNSWRSGKEKESRRCLVFESTINPENRLFHVVVVQWRQRNVQKKVMHDVQSCCFAKSKPIAFCRFRWRRCCRCFSSLLNEVKQPWHGPLDASDLWMSTQPCPQGRGWCLSQSREIAQKISNRR